MIVDRTWMILRVRDASYKFTEKKALPVTVTTAEGVESKPLAATGGPDLADIRFSAEPKDIDALLATRHLDIRTETHTVRLSFAGLAEAKADFDQCMANIGSPAKGWSSAEVDQLIEPGQARQGEVQREQAHPRHDLRRGLMSSADLVPSAPLPPGLQLATAPTPVPPAVAIVALALDDDRPVFPFGSGCTCRPGCT